MESRIVRLATEELFATIPLEPVDTPFAYVIKLVFLPIVKLSKIETSQSFVISDLLNLIRSFRHSKVNSIKSDQIVIEHLEVKIGHTF